MEHVGLGGGPGQLPGEMSCVVIEVCARAGGAQHTRPAAVPWDAARRERPAAGALGRGGRRRALAGVLRRPDLEARAAFLGATVWDAQDDKGNSDLTCLGL